jgi:glycosyltransferase involved in cell wall biosynthesis
LQKNNSFKVDKPKVLLTFDSMKYPNSGFYYFGKSLGDCLLEQNNGQFDLTYYLHKRALYQFDNKVDIKYLSWFHKLYYPSSTKYDLVHFTDQYCRLKPQKVNAKKILTIHDLNPIHEKRKPAHKIKEHIDKLTNYIKLCNYVVAISNFVANDILNYIPEAAGKIKVIYNGADRLIVPDNHAPAFDPGKPFLFTIGHVSAKKNFHVLPALLQGNDLVLIIAGIETPYKDQIMEEAKKHNCQDRVIITGPISDDDKSWYYKNCEAFVFPSIAEGFGLPVIEAMYFGKPVFLSTHTSLPEVGGNAAFYFNSFDAGEMQNVFAQGMDQYRNNNMQPAIIAHANQFTWQHTAQQYLQLYADCLAD